LIWRDGTSFPFVPVLNGLEKVNPMKIRVFKSGYSSKVEDADLIVLEDFWSPGKIIDTYYDVLNKADLKYIENIETYN